MSALPPIADIRRHECNVRFVPEADIPPLFDYLVITGAGHGFTTQFQKPIQLAVWLCVTGLAAAQ